MYDYRTTITEDVPVIAAPVCACADCQALDYMIALGPITIERTS